ncbi:MAG: polysaccharide deacetylase family protein [Nitrososphaerales archaeon]
MLALFWTALMVGGCVAQPHQPAIAVAVDSSATPAADLEGLGQSRTPTPELAATPLPTTPAATKIAPPAATRTATAAATATVAATATAAQTATRTATATSSPTATPGLTPDGVERELHVPILMYHYISQPPTGADIYRRDLSVTPERFAEQMRYLRDAGYSTITLDDLLYALAQGRPLPPKPIILTFDDGYADNYENAFPILREYGFVGTFFLMTDLVTDGAAGYMTWPKVEEMAAAGQRFGSHGRQDHRSLAGRSLDYLVWVALGSKEAIEEHLGYQPRWVAYPSGEYDNQTVAVFESAGYWGGLTTLQGTTHSLDDIFELRRIRVRGSHTAQDLAKLLALQW